ncbi:Pr6Pr family membrane protein [Xanthobacter dioxanivorans]|uniref:Pr6Pr family membrane protein n=1 Tax=Xanthobacter dioxanivorans TaxID=2528964 RepID=A0A974SKV5_9HYPH|nr:Pr6Pr family membrane protein [Xanthobacter dioxanivorans]QRG09235.1 Pr6Pr family membrane protein [Xanthobacter dioxanivorans]
MEDWARRAAAVTAGVAWVALALQLGIVVVRMAAIGQGLGAAAWRFLGFFTVLTNGLVAVVATAVALYPAGRIATPRLRLMAVVSIVLVGIIYALLLRHVWNPTGWQAVADHLLHEATPLLFLATWGLSRHGSLAVRDALWAMAPPILYLAYALARGEADGWYAYWFLDPAKLGDGRMALNTVLLAAAFLATALLFLGIDRLLARRIAR